MDKTQFKPFSAGAGTVLFRPGSACPGLIELDAGSIRVSLIAASGRELVLYRVHPGELCLQTFACLTTGETYGAEGVAETALSGRLLPAAAFRGALASDAGLRDRVLSGVARRFGEYEHLVEEVALAGFDARLARALLRLAGARDRVEITHEALAAETVSGRAVVTRQLAKFQSRGLVATGRGHVDILDREALRGIAADPV